MDSRLRRYYRLSDAGVDRLAADVERQRRNAETVAARLAARTRPTPTPTPAPAAARRRVRRATA